MSTELLTDGVVGQWTVMGDGDGDDGDDDGDDDGCLTGDFYSRAQLWSTITESIVKRLGGAQFLSLGKLRAVMRLLWPWA